MFPKPEAIFELMEDATVRYTGKRHDRADIHSMDRRDLKIAGDDLTEIREIMAFAWKNPLPKSRDPGAVRLEGVFTKQRSRLFNPRGDWIVKFYVQGGTDDARDTMHGFLTGMLAQDPEHERELTVETVKRNGKREETEVLLLDAAPSGDYKTRMVYFGRPIR